MADSEYPFSLRGTTEAFRGLGRSDGETVTSRVFTLSKGIVIADVEPDPDDFVLRVVPAEGLTKGGAIAVSSGGALAGMAGGAALGSVVPVAGTIVGGAIGGLAGLLAVKAHDKIKPRIWDPTGLDVALVNSDDKKDIPEYQSWLSLREGKYRLVVKSEQPWRIKLIQPELGQSYGPLIDALEAEHWESGGTVSIVGPYDSSSRPIRASIQHRGKGAFAIMAIAVDGTHQCVVYHHEEEGQFAVEDHQTLILPGKEYMLYIVADGDWKMTLKESY